MSCMAHSIDRPVMPGLLAIIRLVIQNDFTDTCVCGTASPGISSMEVRSRPSNNEEFSKFYSLAAFQIYLSIRSTSLCLESVVFIFCTSAAADGERSALIHVVGISLLDIFW